MTDKSGVSEQIISLPKGGGELKGLGEKFQPDLHTGTGNFSIPIAVPAGRNGFQPQISLNYSTGVSNGPFGLGWTLGVPSVSRKTSKGIPQYQDTFDNEGPNWNPNEDIFLLSGSDDLVHVGGNFYRPKTEGSFARIQKVQAPSDGQPCWIVTSKSGIRSIYGKNGNSRVFVNNNGVTKIYEWLLSETEDTFGNKIIYDYKRDSGQDLQADPVNHPEERNHEYNQIYLQTIQYVNFGEVQQEEFLWRIEFDYGEYNQTGDLTGVWETRPDRFSSYRAGFEIRTARRCKRILIKGRTLDDNGTPINRDQYHLIKSYDLSYTQDDLSNISLLTKVVLKGYKDGNVELFPPITLDYTRFQPQSYSLETISAERGTLPNSPLSDPNYEIIDLFGNSLPCIVNSGFTGWRYWRNQGNASLAVPQSMTNAPAGVVLADNGVQFADMDGDGSVDLLVLTDLIRKYYTKDTRIGEWTQFHELIQAPNFNLEDPTVRLVDLNGDGVIDVLQTLDESFLFIKNLNDETNLEFARPVQIQRVHDLDLFPDVSFDAPGRSVRLGDMSGDGLQDIVVVNPRGRIDYWPNIGYGRFGKRITFCNTATFPNDFDQNRLFVVDVNGDGSADLVYVEYGRVHLWINQSGNCLSQEVVIDGTPPLTNIDSIRIADMDGTGIAGLLYSYDPLTTSGDNYKYLDLNGAGVKPLLLNSIDNNIGAKTAVEYHPSTYYYINDLRSGLMWKTTLPFPVQVVSRIEVFDLISNGKFSSEYIYHHGYWDGVEREFRGFGRVDQRDSESFLDFNSSPLPVVGDSQTPSGVIVPMQYFSPPTETRNWFHQGGVYNKEIGRWEELDFRDEFWSEDVQVLARPQSMTTFLNNLPDRTRYNALRTLRGHRLRTELYALDNTDKQTRPYTVSESLSGVLSLPIGDPWIGNGEEWRKEVFFPHGFGERTSQWERGNDPMSKLKFIEDYDEYGQARLEINIAVPRGRAFQTAATPGEPYLATKTETTYARRDEDQIYIVDRIARITSYEILNDGSPSFTALKNAIEDGTILPTHRIVSQTLRYYDGPAFQGLPFDNIGDYGALVRTEDLVLTKDILHEAYKSGSSILEPPVEPPYMASDGNTVWTEDYPQDFRDLMPIDNSTDPTRPGFKITPVGYGYSLGDAEAQEGYFAATERRSYDFQDLSNGPKKGLVRMKRDPLGRDTSIVYDTLDFLPTQVTNPSGLTTSATYEYRVQQPNNVTDVNGNRTLFGFTPMGFLESICVLGKVGKLEGDTPDNPSILINYDLAAFTELGQPIHVHTFRRTHHHNESGVTPIEANEIIETVEYYDAFGRVAQIRTKAEDILFGQTLFGDSGLPIEQSNPDVGDAIGVQQSNGVQNVVVSGSQVYDNKSHVVEKHEPFFSVGYEYEGQQDFQRGEKIRLYYDPLGRVVRTVNPDGSIQQIVYGVPLGDLTDPEEFTPTPWEVYTYDFNDNAARTHPVDSLGYSDHWNTPTSVVLDALARKTKSVERNGLDSAKWYTTRYAYDIRGKLLSVTDPLNRSAFSYIYDLCTSKTNVIRIEQLDTGIQRYILDSAGNTIEKRDGKGAILLHSLDRLNRPIRLWARDEISKPISLREILIYGDDESNSGITRNQAVNLNLLGKLFKHYDEAGLIAFIPDPDLTNSKPYDFKGNALEKVRQTIDDTIIMSTFDLHTEGWKVSAFRIDWQPPDDGTTLENYANTLLDIKVHRTSLNYDALNRIKTIVYPKDIDGSRKVLRTRYNRGGFLEHVNLDDNTFVERISYNARGQRILVVYGNNVMTRYTYDTRIFRLKRMRSEKYTTSTPLLYHHSTTVFHDIAYEYDLTGNILNIHDRSPRSGIPNTALGTDGLDRLFTYDPVYHLLSATGREYKYDFEELPAPWSRELHATDLTMARSYTEEYLYDDVGNMQHFQHHANDGTGGFTRNFGLERDSNRLKVLTIGNTISYNYVYDPAGNIITEASSRHFEWDHSNRMCVYYTQANNSEPSVYAYHFYDSYGQKVKKLVRKQGERNIESTIYIDPIFEYHRDTAGDSLAEYNILHIRDNERKIAIVRVGNALQDDPTPAVKYTLLDHLDSINILIDDTGALINREEYSPYGETSFGSFAKKRYRFMGKEYNEENSLYYFGARYYTPWLVRWLSSDPLGLAAGLNPYTFTQNNPIRLIDPTGAQATESKPTPQSSTEPSLVPPLTLIFEQNISFTEKVEQYNKIDEELHRIEVIKRDNYRWFGTANDRAQDILADSALRGGLAGAGLIAKAGASIPIMWVQGEIIEGAFALLGPVLRPVTSYTGRFISKAIEKTAPFLRLDSGITLQAAETVANVGESASTRSIDQILMSFRNKAINLTRRLGARTPQQFGNYADAVFKAEVRNAIDEGTLPSRLQVAPAGLTRGALARNQVAIDVWDPSTGVGWDLTTATVRQAAAHERYLKMVMPDGTVITDVHPLVYSRF